jgi:predicted lipoprotein with Yx(FWY)xxD motif
MRYSLKLPLVASLPLLALLAACGGTSSTGATASSTTAPYASPSTAAPAPTTPAAPSGPAKLALAKTTLGSVLVDAQGRTLYMYVPDTAGKSTCYSQCATFWPPALTTGAPVAGTGLTGSLLGTTTRTDGTVQVTYDKYPLYLYIKDTAAGDVTGQGVQKIWYVLNAQGIPVKTAP